MFNGGIIFAFAGYSKNQRQLAYEAALTEMEIPFIYHHMPVWNFRLRREWQQQVAWDHPKNILVFTDACDYIILSHTKDELVEKLTKLGPVCFPAQRECWPVPEWEGVYPDPEPRGTTPWKYLNASGPHGWGEAIADSISDCRKRYPLTDVPGELHGIDEWAWQQMHMEGLVNVDTGCVFTQCLYSTPEGDLECVYPRVRNTITGSWPVLIHGNGSSLNHAHHRRMFDGHV